MSGDKIHDSCVILSKGAFDPEAVFMDDIPVTEPIAADAEFPVILTEPHELEVYGFETSLWQKLRGYIGF